MLRNVNGHFNYSEDLREKLQKKQKPGKEVAGKKKQQVQAAAESSDEEEEEADSDDENELDEVTR